MIDHYQRQRDTAASEGLTLFADGVSLEAWAMGVTRRSFPIGARYFWALQAVYIPSNSKEAAE